MKISYAIPVCNEIEEIKRLLEFLIKTKRAQDEIVIVIDEQNGTEEVKDYVEDFAHEYIDLEDIKVLYHPLNKDFATHKNFINAQCSGDFIMNIDADEIPNTNLMEILPSLIKTNPNIEAYWVPRINTVEGIGLSQVKKWSWNVSKLNTQIGEKELDLNNPQDKDEYELLKKYNLIIEEITYSK